LGLNKQQQSSVGDWWWTNKEIFSKMVI